MNDLEKNQDECGMDVVDIGNFCLLENKYKKYLEEKGQTVSDNSEILKECSSSISQLLSIMDGCQNDLASGENYVIGSCITPYRVVTEKEMLVKMIKEAAGTNLFDKQIEEQIRNMDDGDVDIVYLFCEQIYCQRKLDLVGSFKKIICEASEKNCLRSTGRCFPKQNRFTIQVYRTIQKGSI